ncbi:MAG: argininosuccinate lyase, partial [Cetobacterium sp.]
ITGEIVSYCIDNGLNLETLSLEKYREFSYIFNGDIYETIAIKNCVEKRKSLGGPSKESLLSHLERLNEFLDGAKIDLINYRLNDIM